MKFYKIALLFVLIYSCSSKKEIVTNSSKNGIETLKVKDSLIQEVILESTAKSKDPKIEDVTESPKKTIPKQNADNLLTIDYDVESITGSIKKPEHNAFNKLLKKYVSKNGNVNYKDFKNDHNALLNYISLISNNVPNDTWKKEDIMAFWINAYNAMTVDLILRHYPIKSIKDIEEPWKQRHWKLGDKWHNLNDIEHQILRKMNDPRIHFAIVCASMSCPKLSNEAFTALNVESKLTIATQEFINDSSKNKITKNSLELSKIFQWFTKDFKQHRSLIDFLNQYSEIEISKNAKKSFKNYNWNLNE